MVATGHRPLVALTQARVWMLRGVYNGSDCGFALRVST
jgi:hypothetical protein